MDNPVVQTLRRPRFLTVSMAREMGILLCLSVMFPFMVHLLPVPGDARLGPRLLPMFYAPLLAALWGRRETAVMLAVVAPWLNRAITGYPPTPGAVVLMIQLLVFVGAYRGLMARTGPRWFHAAPAFLAAMAVSGLVGAVDPRLIGGQPAAAWVISSVTLSLPGIGILVLVNWVALRCYPPGGDGGALA